MDAPEGQLTGRRVLLLGPQRRPTVDQVVAQLEADGPLATVTAGWQEREPDDAELDELLGGRSANLHLYGRWLDIQQRDPELAAAATAQRELLEELRTLHLVQLEHAKAALYALRGRNGDRPEVIDTAVADAEAVLRLIDERHCEKVNEVHREFEAAVGLDEREAVAEHRALVAKMLEQAGALFLAGGHVGVLLRLLSLFRVAETLPETLVAWSAGAMCLTDSVVLFHDRTPQGRSPVEIFDRGMGVLQGLVLLPDARRRLDFEDAVRMAEIARRFTPATCVTLERGDCLDLQPGSTALPPQARIVGTDGRITTEAER
jgi:hypothetical protein